jgi:hypothetical protein
MKNIPKTTLSIHTKDPKGRKNRLRPNGFFRFLIPNIKEKIE